MNKDTVQLETGECRQWAELRAVWIIIMQSLGS